MECQHKWTTQSSIIVQNNYPDEQFVLVLVDNYMYMTINYEKTSQSTKQVLPFFLGWVGESEGKEGEKEGIVTVVAFSY